MVSQKNRFKLRIMKKVLSLVFAASAFIATAQPKKAPKMTPVLEPGYYVSGKSDTVRGEVQVNPEDLTELYRQFSFRPGKGGKVMPVSPTKAKAYGYGDKHYFQITCDEGTIYVERLVQGRLNLFKYRFNGKIDGRDAVETYYYMQDTRAEGPEAATLREVKKISNKFYKRDLKAYLKDQLMVWTDLDKFVFDEGKVIAAITEFNKFYTVTAD
jgi:hypothetical protein